MSNPNFSGFGMSITGLESVIDLFTLHRIADRLNIRIAPMDSFERAPWQERDEMSVTWNFWVESPDTNVKKLKQEINNHVQRTTQIP